MDWSRLSEEELSQFYSLYGGNQNVHPDWIFQHIIGSVVPPFIVDLYIASRLKDKFSQKYSISQLANLSHEHIYQFAYIFGLDWRLPDINIRIERILRFLDAVILHNKDPFEDLPNEIVLNILENYPDIDLSKVCQTNRRLSNICNDIWISKLQKYGLNNITPEDKPSELYFQIRSILDQSHDSLCSYNTFMSAAQSNYLVLLDVLLRDCQIDPSQQDSWAISLAAMNGHLNIINRLLQDPRVDPSGNNNAGIVYASQNGHYNVVDRLLKDPRVDPSVQNNKAFTQSLNKGFINVAKRLLQDQKVRKQLLIDLSKDLSKDLPSIDLSKDLSIDLPSKDLPSIDLPSKDLPSIDLPSKDLPSIDLPSKSTIFMQALNDNRIEDAQKLLDDPELRNQILKVY